jgi:2-methylcitrate dehydratase PrpD
MSLTRSLARLIDQKPVGDEDLAAAALFVLDTVANAVAARHTPQGQILRDWYGRRSADAGRHAFLFGALAHILEMDDLHRESVTHPGCVVVPAAWAIATERGSGGHDFLKAVLAGYEAVCRVGNSVGQAHYRVWHNTATCGPYGAALAAASLLELREEPTVWALGNAGTQSAGLWQFLEEGAMSKHLHAGRAAEAGILAAELAARGFTGPAAILEGPKGFFVAACPDAQPQRLLASPDAPWQLRLTSIKPWPSCRHTHPAVEAALDLHGRVDPDAVASVRIETYRAALALCDNAAPSSEYEAKFSLQHCTAAALCDGKLMLGSFDGPARTRLTMLASRTTAVATAEHDAAYPDRWGARVTLATTAGDTLVAERPGCKGDPEHPVTPKELLEKASMLLEHGGMRRDRAAALIDSLLALPEGGALPQLEPLFRDSR